MRDLITYDPNHMDSSSSDKEDLVAVRRSRARRDGANRQKNDNDGDIDMEDVSKHDIKLLRQVVGTTDALREDAPDFAAMYQVFEDFKTKNQFRDETLASRILVNLCRYRPVLSDWTARLERCLRDNSLGEYAAYKEAVLNQKVAYIRLEQRRAYLYKWVHAYRSLAHNVEDMQVFAEMYDTEILKREGFGYVIQAVRSVNERHIRADSHYEKLLKTRTVGLISQKAKRAKQLRQAKRQIVWGKSLRKWMTRYDNVRRAWDTAVAMDIHNTKHDYLISWAFESVGSQVAQRYNTVMLGDVFSAWGFNTQRVVELSTAAAAKNVSNSQQKYYNRWSDMLVTVQTDGELAEEIYSTNVLANALIDWHRKTKAYEAARPLFEKKRQQELQSYLTVWKHRNRLILECECYMDYRDKNFLAQVLAVWRLRAERHSKAVQLDNKRQTKLVKQLIRDWRTDAVDSQAAGDFHCLALLKRVLTQWRLDARYQTLVHYQDYNLARRVWHQWILQQRFILFRRYTGDRLIVRTLQHWQRKQAKLSLDLDRREQLVNDRNTRNLACRTLAIWVDKFDDIGHDSVTADRIYKTHLLQRGMTAFYNTVYNANKRYTQAVAFDREHRCSSVLAQWRIKAKVRRKERLQQLLAEYRAARDAQLAQSALTIWLNSTLDVAHFAQVADHLHYTTTKTIGSRVLKQWVSHLDQVQRHNSRADSIYVDRTLSRWITQWVDRWQHMAMLNEEAETRRNVRDEKVYEYMFRAWRMRMFRIQSLNRDCDSYAQQLQVQRFKNVLRSWAAKANYDAGTMVDSDQMAAAPASPASFAVTPSRSKLSSIDKWRQMRSTTPRRARPSTGSSSTTVNEPSTPIRKPSGLRHELFKNSRNTFT